MSLNSGIQLSYVLFLAKLLHMIIMLLSAERGHIFCSSVLRKIAITTGFNFDHLHILFSHISENPVFLVRPFLSPVRLNLGLS